MWSSSRKHLPATAGCTHAGSHLPRQKQCAGAAGGGAHLPTAGYWAASLLWTWDSRAATGASVALSVLLTATVALLVLLTASVVLTVLSRLFTATVALLLSSTGAGVLMVMSRSAVLSRLWTELLAPSMDLQASISCDSGPDCESLAWGGCTWSCRGWCCLQQVQHCSRYMQGTLSPPVPPRRQLGPGAADAGPQVAHAANGVGAAGAPGCVDVGGGHRCSSAGCGTQPMPAQRWHCLALLLSEAVQAHRNAFADSWQCLRGRAAPVRMSAEWGQSMLTRDSLFGLTHHWRHLQRRWVQGCCRRSRWHLPWSPTCRQGGGTCDDSADSASWLRLGWLHMELQGVVLPGAGAALLWVHAGCSLTSCAATPSAGPRCC